MDFRFTCRNQVRIFCRLGIIGESFIFYEVLLQSISISLIGCTISSLVGSVRSPYSIGKRRKNRRKNAFFAISSFVYYRSCERTLDCLL